LLDEAATTQLRNFVAGFAARIESKPRDFMNPNLRVERITSHVGDVGGVPIQRARPRRGGAASAPGASRSRRPAELPAERRMRVGPHPHTGLQTFSWMIEGEILHRDSLGHEQVLRRARSI